LIEVTRETHETPQEVSDILLLAGGVNRFGEPNFRCVWGGSRLDWIGGKWTDRDDSENQTREVIEVRRVPKYHPEDRWHIERWLPPELYGSPETWYSQTMENHDGLNVPALGPYPSRGEYEHCFTLQGPHGEFIQITPAAARHIAGALELSKSMAKGNLLKNRNAHIEKQDKEYDSYADSVLNDTNAFSTQPHVYQL